MRRLLMTKNDTLYVYIDFDNIYGPLNENKGCQGKYDCPENGRESRQSDDLLRVTFAFGAGGFFTAS
jgi:hypothetical protein